MPPKSKKTSSPDDRMSALEAQVGQLASAMTGMTENLGNIVAALGRAPAAATGPAAASTPGRSTGQGDWSETYYYVRIKPYNPKRGFVRKRTLVPELGRPINGGTGEMGNVPEWMRVKREAAMALTKYHQKENDLESPRVFDIVTKEQMDEINAREDQQRMSNLGLAGMSPAEVLRQADQGKLTAKVREAPQRGKPSTVEGSDRFARVQPGRRDALAGIEVQPPAPQPMPEEAAPPPPPPPPAVAPVTTAKVEEPFPYDDGDDDGAEAPAAPARAVRNRDVEDLSIDAARASLDSEMARVAALTEGPMGRVRPK